MFFFEGEKTEYCEKGTDSELAAMRNVAGEILGAQVAMKMAVEQGRKVLRLSMIIKGLPRGVPENGKQKREPKPIKHTLIP